MHVHTDMQPQVSSDASDCKGTSVNQQEKGSTTTPMTQHKRELHAWIDNEVLLNSEAELPVQENALRRLLSTM